MNNIKFAVVGFGGAGRAHVRRLLSIKGVQIKAVYDPKIAQLGKVPRLFKQIKFTDKFDQIFSEDIDAVTICTPDHTHFQYAKLAVENNLHTLVEKPMFVTLDQCSTMAKLLENHPVVFGVHHQMRYVPTFKAAQKLVQEGILGKILLIEADYVHDMRARARAFDNWRLDIKNPQNIVLGGLSHTFDLIRWIANEKVTDLFSFASHKGWTDYPDVDTVITTLRFSSGLIAKTSMTITSAGPQRNTLTIYGTKGQIHNNLLINEHGLKSIIIHPKEVINWKQNFASKMITFLSPVYNYPFSIYEHNRACCLLLEDFVNSIRINKNFSIALSEGQKVIKLCLDAISSYQNNKVVRFETIDDKSTG